MASALRTTRYLQQLLAIVAGVLLVNVSWRHWAASSAGSMELFGVIVGLGIIVLNVLKFHKTLRRDVTNYVVLKSDTGTVRVHASAMEEALRATARSLPEVHDARVRLLIDRQTSVPSAGEVEARVKDITNIVSVHDALSRVLAERYEQIVPGAPPIEFHLTIKHHFKPPSKPKKRKQIVPPEEDETKSIRAPQYPVPRKK